MNIRFWGTRGSIPVAGKEHAEFGGNTTCVQIGSPCLPLDRVLVIDAGTGIIPLSYELLGQQDFRVKGIDILFTHYHHDHTQGLMMMPHLYMKDRKANYVEMYLLGPEEHKIGPHAVVKHLMGPPYFPVCLEEVGSHIFYKGIDQIAGKVIMVHPSHKPHVITVEELERAEEKGQLKIGQVTVNVNDCLVIRMFRCNHPEYTISYRFEERPTGRVFVFMTDHENTDGVSQALHRHSANADILVMDCQYSREQYNARTAGFGHSTPDYCVLVAKEVGAKKLGLTHHDPGRDDQALKAILESANQTAEQIGYEGEIISLRDHEMLV